MMARAEIHRQSGLVWLATLLIALLGTIGFTLSAHRRDAGRERETVAALARAREALLAHAVLFGELHRTNADPPGSVADDDVTLPPGTLPCPETAASLAPGVESSPCGNRDQAALGRLPWRSLGLEPLRDGFSECLWYAVSGAYKANPPAHLLNWDSAGDIDIHDAEGKLLAADVAAVVFAPGPALPGQERQGNSGGECGKDPAPSAYLESIVLAGAVFSNNSAPAAGGAKARFVAGPVRDARGDWVLNDRLVYLTREDLFAGAIARRKDFPGTYLFDAADQNGNDPSRYALAQKLASCIANYGRHNLQAEDKRLPWAAPAAPESFDRQSLDDRSGLHAGRPPYRVGTSTGATRNTLVPSGCSSRPDDCRLLVAERCLSGWWRVAGKPLDAAGALRWQSPEGWWDRWKDHFFYVVSPEYSPASGNDWTVSPDPCSQPGNRCLTVGGRRYAAAVIFGGARGPGQKRAGTEDRGNPANYLEGENAAAFAWPASDQPRSLAATGNDQLVCIRPDLSIASDCR